MKLIVPIRTGRLGKTGILLRAIYDYWIHLLNYYSFHSLNKKKIGHKRAGIVFSKYLQNLIPGSYLIYHGSEPNVTPPLLYSADALILPYRVSSASGVLFDGFSHGLPFISSKLEFFSEFYDLGLGISVDRKPAEFSSALLRLKKDYKKYKKNVSEFRRKLLWKAVTSKHIVVYNSLINNPASILRQKILD